MQRLLRAQTGINFNEHVLKTLQITDKNNPDSLACDKLLSALRNNASAKFTMLCDTHNQSNPCAIKK